MLKMLLEMVRLGGVAASVVVSSLAFAQTSEPVLKVGAPQNFQVCDGYGAPNENGDGITKAASGFLGIFIPEPKSGDTGMRGLKVSAYSIEACTDALGNATRLLPQYHVRRASLLRARAIHRFGTGDKKGAQADLDAADIEGGQETDPFYQRSMALGNQLFHAYFALSNGQNERAAVLLRAAAKARPYSGAVQRLANAMLFNAERDADARYAALDRLATLNSNLRPLLMQEAVDRLDWAKVIETRAQIDFTPPKENQVGFLLENYPLVLARLFVDRFRADTLTSFALVASGRDAEGQASLRELEQRLVPLKADLPVGPDGRKPRRELRDAHRYLQAYRFALEKQLVAARANAELLAQAQRGGLQSVTAAIARGAIPHDGFGLAILRALRDAKAETPEINALEASLRDAKARHDREPITLGIDQLYAAVPSPETRQRIPKYAASKSFWGDTGNGFFLGTDGPIELVGFQGLNTTEAVVEELALLKAAQDTLAAGKERFALVDKDVVGRNTMHGYMGLGRPIASGYSVTLRVIRFGSEGPPRGYEAFAGRAIDAHEVVRALAPVYDVQVAPAES
ncbi:hypothetical protein [Sphingomonas sp. R1]|uniref:hypothetical protein n=1 Tax=Sphingomonas sp. R1 TaxID=399176 RepID=UPI002224A1AB|nr:hypothetical protein [Sphingomonas sp. R1]UYY76552.1 hypothetical protein OIM94_13640 [Sphingomonas sp. R1]